MPVVHKKYKKNNRCLATIPSGCSLDRLPADFRKILTPLERRAYRNLKSTFGALSKKCSLRSLSRLLKKCAAFDSWTMVIDTDHDIGPVVFRFELEGEPFGLSIRPGNNRSCLPVPLRSIYAVVGGTEHEPGFAAGLCHIQEMITDKEMRTWMDHAELEYTGRGDIHGARFFLANGYGDHMGILKDGTAVWYDHDYHRLNRIGSLQTALNRYFKAVLEGNSFQIMDLRETIKQEKNAKERKARGKKVGEVFALLSKKYVPVAERKYCVDTLNQLGIPTTYEELFGKKKKPASTRKNRRSKK